MKHFPSKLFFDDQQALLIRYDAHLDYIDDELCSSNHAVVLNFAKAHEALVVEPSHS